MMTKTTKEDFFPNDLFPNGVSFLYPDHMVRFSAYATTLTIENARQSVATGERIPASAVTARLVSEFGLTPELVAQYRLIGNYVTYDRELRDLSPEELREREIADEPTDDELALSQEDADALVEGFQKVVDERTRYSEVDKFLSDLFGEEGK
jgi:hypothetical protein